MYPSINSTRGSSSNAPFAAAASNCSRVSSSGGEVSGSMRVAAVMELLARDSSDPVLHGQTPWSEHGDSLLAI
jgi:hypothetical protein